MYDLFKKCARILWRPIPHFYRAFKNHSYPEKRFWDAPLVHIHLFLQNALRFDICAHATSYSLSQRMDALRWAIARHDSDSIVFLVCSSSELFSVINRATAQKIDALLCDPAEAFVEKCLFPEHFNINEILATFGQVAPSAFVSFALYLKEKFYSEAFLQKREQTVLTLLFVIATVDPILARLLDNPVVQQHLRKDRFTMLQDLLYIVDSIDALPVRYRLPLYILAFPENILGKNPLDHAWMAHYFLHDNGARLKVLWQNGFSMVRKNLQTHLKIYGFPILQYMDAHSPDTHMLSQYIQSPDLVLSSLGLSMSACLAVKMLKTKQDIVFYEHPHRLPSLMHNTNGDNASMAKQAKHFLDKIKPLLMHELQMPALQSKFGKIVMGTNNFTDAIEKIIRRDLLNAIKHDAEKELQGQNIAHAQQIINFIKKTKANPKKLDRLLSGQDAGMMQAARVLFSSIEHAAQIAWRGYDQFAPVREGELSFPNLLTPQLSEDITYSVHEISDKALTKKAASEMARELMAITYYALLYRDTKLSETQEDAQLAHSSASLSSMHCANRLTHIIARLAEMRRANNEGESQYAPAEEDNPSCIVAIFNRCNALWEMDPELMQQVSSEAQIKRILGNNVVARFKTKLSECVDENSNEDSNANSNGNRNANSHEKIKTDWYDALIGLRKETAEDFLQLKTVFTSVEERQEYFEEQQQRERLASLRLHFISEMGNIHDIFYEINQQLVNEKAAPLLAEEIIYVQEKLLDIGGGWIAPSLTAEYRQQMPQRQNVALADPTNPPNHFTPQQHLNRQTLVGHSSEPEQNPRQSCTIC